MLSAILDDVYRRAILLQRFEAGLRFDVAAMLEGVVGDVIARAAGRKLTDYQAARMDALLADVSALVDTGYQQAFDRLDADLRGLAQIEARAARNSISTAYSLATVGMPAPDMLAAIVDRELILGGPARDWWADQGRAARMSFTRTIRRGMVEGATTDQLKRELSQAGGVAVRHAEALVRTSVQTVANGARMATYAANDDIVAGLQWLSTLDARTSATCQGRSGLRWTLDGKPHGHHVKFIRPPAHFNCRSTLIPLLDMDEQLDGTQASADGPQAAGWSFEDWLRTKSPADQDAMLGAARARRWRKGDYTLSQLIDQDGRPLTLAQLDALTGKAEAVTPPVAKQAQTPRDYIAIGDGITERALGAGSLELLGENGRAKSVGDRLYAELSGLREFGLQAKVSGRGKGAEITQQAATFYPAEWVRVSNAGPEMRTKYREGGRGFHLDLYRPDAMGKRYRIPEWGVVSVDKPVSFLFMGGSGGADTLKTAVHEFGHRLQSMLPGLDAIFQAEHVRRTAGDALEKMADIYPGYNYKSDELTRRDHYLTAYTGKEYSIDKATGRGRALEVLTMAFEVVLMGGSRGNLAQRARFAELYDKDRQLFNLAVGLLASWKP